jgi:hypothetical protein
VYRLVPDPATVEQIAALPTEALASYVEVLTALEVAPWSGHPQHRDIPDAPVRWWSFGPGAAGQVMYLVLEDQREVHLLLVQWIG